MGVSYTVVATYNTIQNYLGVSEEIIQTMERLVNDPSNDGGESPGFYTRNTTLVPAAAYYWVGGASGSGIRSPRQDWQERLVLVIQENNWFDTVTT